MMEMLQDPTVQELVKGAALQRLMQLKPNLASLNASSSNKAP